MAYFDAWWFNNTQQQVDILQPDFFTPKTHYGVYAELGKISLPFILIYTARNNNGLILHSKKFHIHESGVYENFEIEVEPKEGVFVFKSLAESLNELPATIEVEYKDDKTEYKENIYCSYSTLNGRITDFTGNAFPAPLLLFRTGFDGKNSYMGTWSNSNGEYSITVPKGTYNAFFIDDNSYGKTTLECWGWHMLVDRDEQLDFKIGNGEVYSLHAWPSNGGLSTLFIYFRPMILPSLKEEKYKMKLNDRDFNIFDISPDLTVEDISIRVNGIRSEIISLQKIYETGIYNDENKGMPAYIVQIRRNHSTVGKQTLIVEYDTYKRKLKDERVLLAQSQGYLQYFYHSCGTCIR